MRGGIVLAAAGDGCAKGLDLIAQGRKRIVVGAQGIAAGDGVHQGRDLYARPAQRDKVAWCGPPQGDAPADARQIADVAQHLAQIFAELGTERQRFDGVVPGRDRARLDQRSREPLADETFAHGGVQHTAGAHRAGEEHAGERAGEGLFADGLLDLERAQRDAIDQAVLLAAEQRRRTQVREGCLLLAGRARCLFVDGLGFTEVADDAARGVDGRVPGVEPEPLEGPDAVLQFQGLDGLGLPELPAGAGRGRGVDGGAQFGDAGGRVAAGRGGEDEFTHARAGQLVGALGQIALVEGE
jgi:hypothetical protein